jgi:hypothetical protein
VKSAVPTGGTEDDAVFEGSGSSDYNTGNKYNTSGERFRGLYDESTFLSAHYLHFVRTPL